MCEASTQAAVIRPGSNILQLAKIDKCTCGQPALHVIQSSIQCLLTSLHASLYVKNAYSEAMPDKLLHARLVWFQHNTQPELCLMQLTHHVVVIKKCSILHILSFLLATVLTDIEMPCSVAQPVKKSSFTVALAQSLQVLLSCT